MNDCASLYVGIQYGDVATCTTRLKIACTNALNAPSTGATAGQAESCASAVGSAACADVLGRNPPGACKTVAGSLADGTACGDDAQCSGKNCRASVGSTCGACSTRAAAGGACSSSGDCDYGFTCANKVCVTPGAAGAMCDVGHPCATSFACKGGTCVQRQAAGATCDVAAQDCDNLSGLYCDPKTKVCAKAQLAAAGAACGITSNGYFYCSASGVCRQTSATMPGTCVAAAADGASCDDAMGPGCLPPATCSGGVCKIVDPSACK